MDYNIDKLIEKARNGNAQELMKNLKEEDAKRIKGILQNEEACKQLLNSEQAKKIMEMLKRGGMIGG